MLNPLRDSDLGSLGDATAGAVCLEMCRLAGLSPERVKWLVETGRWQRLYPRVYASFSGPVPLLTRQYAALLYCGEGSMLSHETAGVTWRLCPSAPDLHVTVDYRRQVDPQPGLITHRSRTLTDADAHPSLSPRRSRIERTVIDLLGAKRSADAALGLVADAVRSRATTPDRLREAIESRPRVAWRREILEALPDLQSGAQSSLEVRDARIRRRHGLPAGTRQVRRAADGTEYLDVLIEEWGLHIELDGRLGHDRAREIWRDMRRDNRSEMAGLRHLRYGWADLFDRPCAVAAEQAEVLRQQGWPGRLRRCPSCP